MKIFINLPTWLGDCVMASVALRAIFEHFKGAKFVIFGSSVACELFKECENVQVFVQSPKKRYLNFYRLSRIWGCFDYAFSFRSAFSAKLMLFMIQARHKFCFDKNKDKNSHQVLKYLSFMEHSLNLKVQDTSLFLPFKPLPKTKTLGLNPGAKYGLAKRWDSAYFAKTALAFKNTHKILIFGVQSESEICAEIENLLLKEGCECVNLCGKTSIKELCQQISALDLFISNDSGAMHIAAAYKIKTLAIFGPTKFSQTSPWQNENARILHLDLACMPCMKRVCPLKHHKCMVDLKPELVINAGFSLLKE
ncbi:ADP-heptose--LPS heptosyltransferase [Campylobacter sp. MIT 99-7217]|uniref:glycosyltransferase family 9 protein n=1 Tax=Campylobacter sp. MIT 99-7217 TaxID=535091 RepID=UPI00115BB158|nr:glycosyltransferase family 9 protein [Campylobacter sp. MIT 99-7217]TQR32445.1 ADP-heptose--LPS heptosyltransferase [Campylobacter sp. MIT 99-7217]